MSIAYVTQAFVRFELVETEHACMPTKRGFKCGICRRGNLTDNPEVGDRCKCCHNPVCRTISKMRIDFPRNTLPGTDKQP